MKKLLTILFLFSIGYAQVMPGFNTALTKRSSSTPVVGGLDSLFINVDTVQIQPVTGGWINWSGDPHLNVFSGVSTSGNIHATSVSTANWFQYSGCMCSTAPGNGNTLYTPFPTQVRKEEWFSYNNSSVNQDLYDSTKPKFHFFGLLQGHTYRVVVGGSLSSSYAVFVCTTSYHVKGTLASLNGEQHFNCQDNTTSVATFTGVIPSLSGTIDVYVNAFAGNDVGIVQAVQLFQEN